MSEQVEVTYVAGGNTFDAKDSVGIKRYRLIGVDTPEKGQPGYSEATESLKNIIASKTVATEVAGIDRYGLLLVYVQTADGANVNTTMKKIAEKIDTAEYAELAKQM